MPLIVSRRAIEWNVLCEQTLDGSFFVVRLKNLADPKPRNYGAAGEATPDNKAKL